MQYCSTCKLSLCFVKKKFKCSEAVIKSLKNFTHGVFLVNYLSRHGPLHTNHSKTGILYNNFVKFMHRVNCGCRTWQYFRVHTGQKIKKKKRKIITITSFLRWNFCKLEFCFAARIGRMWQHLHDIISSFISFRINYFC